MLISTEPIFKNNLLLADISSGDSCSILLVFKVWARNLRNSRHHPATSCKKVYISLPTQSVFQIRLCPSYLPSGLLNDTWNIFRLVFQNVADPIQEFPRNPDDRLRFAHSFAVVIKALHHRRVLTDGNPRGFHQQPSQVRMAPLSYSPNMLFFATALDVWNQSHIRTQVIQRGKPRDLTQFQQQDHGRQGADPWNGSQQAHPTMVLFGSGQGQDCTVQLGKDLPQMIKFLQMDLKGHISAGPLQSNSFDPSKESSGPMAHLPLFWNLDPVKEQHGFNLVFAPGLFPPHAQPSPNQTAILQLRPGRNIDPFEFVIAKTPGQLPAIHRIPLPLALFVPGWHIRRVHHDTANGLLDQLVVDPKTTISCFINRVIEGPRKMMSQVVGQGCRARRLAEALVFSMVRVDAHLPRLLVNVQSDENRLPRKIKFVTLFHGKSPFWGWILVQQNNTRNGETCLSFFMSSRKEGPLREASIGGVESGERDFSPAPSGWSGAARRAKSQSSRSTLWITLGNRLSALSLSSIRSEYSR